MHYPTDRIIHAMNFVTLFVEYRLEWILISGFNGLVVNLSQLMSDLVPLTVRFCVLLADQQPTVNG